MHFNTKMNPGVAVACLGEGGTSEGDFYEAINVAGTWKLPIVFVINNNQWAISVPRDKQTGTQTLAQKAVAAGFTGMQVDGNDILATRQIIGDAIEKARRGEGPTLIEALSYRLSDHTTADDASRYQPSKEVEEAKLKEPLSRFKTYLLQEKIWNAQEEEQLVLHCAAEVEKAVAEYLGAKPQPISSMFDYHYAELPEYLVEQRAIAMEEATHA